jgi:hypothetical protein
MRLRSMSAPLALTLLATSPTLGCGKADKADEDGAEGADDSSSADDGADDGSGDGADDGSGDGATDGATDGSADGSADDATDGSADGSTDGAADGGGDGADDGAADGGEPLAEVVFEDDFEGVRVGASGYTGDGAGLDHWDLWLWDSSYYDEYGFGITESMQGGLYTDVGGELTSADPLPAPAGGQQCMYLTGYSNFADTAFFGRSSLRPGAVIIEAERSYTLDLALGRRTRYSDGRARILLFADLHGDDEIEARAEVDMTDLPEGGFAPIRLEIDPSDLLAGTSLQVAVDLNHWGIWGYTSLLVDNVTITATPAPAN